MIAPDGNRSAMARSITTRRPLWVAEVPFADGTVGYATDGTPVDCVRLASLGWSRASRPTWSSSGINHGANLGDDITYSGTVAAALEGVVLGIPAIAVSQQSGARALDFRYDGGFGSMWRPAFVARLVERIEDVPLPASNPAERQLARGRARRGRGDQPRQAHLQDELKLEHEEDTASRGATGSTARIRAFTMSRGPTWRRWRPDGSR